MAAVHLKEGGPVTDLQKITSLRRALHAVPERSGEETRTRALLQNFLRENTTLELHDCGGGFYAAHRELESTKKSLALRADYDALALPDGGAAHLCGHDGHAAALCGVALALEGMQLDRNVFLLFQPAEETGAGAQGCRALFGRELVGEIYGAHNLPGLPLGQVTTRPSTVACGSMGLTLHFSGTAAHAAYPEQGVSPAGAVGKLLCILPQFAPPESTGLVMCTVVGASLGEKAFGKAADSAEIWLTLRAEYQSELKSLLVWVLALSQKTADSSGLRFSWEEQDVFRSTENDPVCAGKLLELCGGTLLPQPMRWSEDFGQYLQDCPGTYFLIGAGEDLPPLHSAGYEYPDALLGPTVEAFLKLLRGA